ncbi:MAG: polysaccharide deacetylase family protein [Nitrososphaerales archaeon]
MKRFLKSAVLETVKRRNGFFSSVGFNRTVLGFLKIGFEPPRRATYPNGASAACVISLDFDHVTRSSRPGSERWFPKRVEDLLVKNRIGTRDMLGVSEKYSVPMTWAICGQTAEEDPESYNLIRRSKNAEQEIGVHTYSHADVASCSSEELEEEVKKCLRVLDLPQNPKTFIFPWNRSAHFDLLEKMGFIAYRDQTRSIGTPREHSGLLDIPPTYYVDGKSYRTQALMKKYLDLCISWDSVFHLWLHPWSVVLDDSGRFVRDTLDPLFLYIMRKREEGVLATCTMGGLASFWRGQKQQLSPGKSLPK